jgi:oxygen-independent coproporphyrinogen-3 oxidase
LGSIFRKTPRKIFLAKFEIFKNSIQTDQIRRRTSCVEENHLKIPKKHWFLADGIASDLFIL